MKRTIFLVAAILFMLAGISAAAAPPLTGAGPANGAAVKASLAKFPLSFIKNEGQKDGSILFYEQGSGHTTAFTRDAVALSLGKSGKAKGEGFSELITLTPVGASAFTVEAAEKQAGKVNYYMGKDPTAWKTGIPTYGAVILRGVYPGIDMKFYGNNSQLEYDLIVTPNADPAKVRLTYKGIGKLSITAAGDLEVTLKHGSVLQKKPYAYQVIDGKKVEVEGRFVLADATTYGFALGSYDRSKTLVIDPALAYSTYLGGSGYDTATAIAVSEGTGVFVAGCTMSADFPLKSARQATYGGQGDAFLTKFDFSGSNLVYSTYIGGSGEDCALSLTLNGDEAYVAGYTESKDFPVSAAYQTTYGGGEADGFIVRFNRYGTLGESTYFGGSEGDYITSISQSTSRIYVAGCTESRDFPVKGAYRTANAGDWEAFAAAFSTSLGLTCSTYLGGSSYDRAFAVAGFVGGFYVAGVTASADFPTASAYQGALQGSLNAFVTKFTGLSCDTVGYSTYLGGSTADVANAIAVDNAENAYVAGATQSSDFPVQNAYQATYGGGDWDGFLTKFGSTGNLAYSTFIGGAKSDKAMAVAIPSGPVGPYVAGYTESPDFPVKDAAQALPAGEYDAFVAKFSISGGLDYSTYLGGANWDGAFGLAVDASGHAFLTGYTTSQDFPVLYAFQAAPGGSNKASAFVAMLNNPALSWALSVSKPGAGSGTVTSADSGINCGSTCSANYSDGTAVTLTATAATGSTLTGWTGCDVVSGSTCRVSVIAARSVNANFGLIPEALTATMNGTGNGGLAATGLTCTGATCTGTYNYGDSVTITATAATGSGFTNWTGCDSVGAAAKINAAKVGSAKVTAVKVSAAKSAALKKGSPAAIAGKTAGATTSTCTVSMTAAKNVTATFTLDTETLTATMAGTGSGTLTATGSGIACTGFTCTGTYNYGDSVTITAAAATGSTFTGWTGCDSTSGTTCTVSMISNKSVTATFAADCAYTINPISRSFTYKGASALITIKATGTNCVKPAVYEGEAWLTTNMSSWANNKGTLKVTASENTGVDRAGTVAIQGNTLNVKQGGKACVLTITPTTGSVAAAGGTGSFSVNAAAGCEWTAKESPDKSWLTVTPATGTGNGSVSYTVSQNTTKAERTGYVTVNLTLNPTDKDKFKITQGK